MAYIDDLFIQVPTRRGALRAGLVMGRLGTWWHWAMPARAQERWSCSEGSWSVRLWRLSVSYQRDMRELPEVAK